MKTEKSPASSTQAKVKPVPDGMHTVTPHLVCAGASDAIAFYQKAFGARELSRMPAPGTDKLMHAAITIGDSMIMLFDEMAEWGALGPKARQGTSVTIHLQVPDADALFGQAVAAGATVVMPLEDAFWGDRYGVLEDPFGHRWSVGTHIRDLTPDEIRQAAQNACC